MRLLAKVVISGIETAPPDVPQLELTLAASERNALTITIVDARTGVAQELQISG